MSQGSAEQGTPKAAQAPAAEQGAQVVEPAVLVRTERQALFMAACVFVVTLACWGGAEFACNKHPPQFKEPTALTAEQLTATAKDAAIELKQRALTGDLSGALALAEGPVAEQIRTSVTQCQAAGTCNAQSGPMTRAEVLRFEAPAVIVRTISLSGGQETREVFRMEKRGKTWKAVARENG